MKRKIFNFSQLNNCLLLCPSLTLMFTLLFQVTLDYKYLRMCISLQGDPKASEYPGAGYYSF